VRQVQIPKAGKPGEFRTLGIPTIYDRVCQQALLNRLEPIFEPVFDEANFGYRRGRSTKDAMRKVWEEIQSGREWIVDADLKDFFGWVDHAKLLSLVAQREALPNGARDAARRSGFTLAQQHTSDAVRSGDAAQGISANEVCR
jgi:retron-type reverse transcriptase